MQRIEAEAMALFGAYEVETNAFGSGGQIVWASERGGTGTASTVFDGPSGTHELTVAYFDEIDGTSPYEITVDGTTVDAWVADGLAGGTLADARSAAQRTVTLDLQTGQEIAISGTAVRGEWGRLDWIEIAPADGSGGEAGGDENGGSSGNDDGDDDGSNDGGDDGTGGGGTGDGGGTPAEPGTRVEAESMALAGAYAVETNADGSGGEIVWVSERGGTGTASTVFDGPAGTYQLTVGYFDEIDGTSPYEITVDGETVDAWVADGLDGGTLADARSAAERTVTLDLLPGQEVTVTSSSVRGEWGRLDWLEFVPDDGSGDDGDGGSGNDSDNDNSDSGGTTAGPGTRIEAESMALSGAYEVESNAFGSGGEIVWASERGGTGTASTVFGGPSGTYQLTVAYFDEIDGSSPYEITVDGTTVDAWVADGLDGGTLADARSATQHTVTLDLQTGQEIAISGTAVRGEWGRLDWVEIAPIDGGGGEGGGNRAPIATDDAYEVSHGTPLDVDAAGGLLANDTDPDADLLALTAFDAVGSAGGSLTVNVDGSFRYVPAGGFSGTETFGYTVSDPDAASDGGNVVFTVEPSANAPLRIMPFGDSITYGVTESRTGTETGGYRPVLWDLLTDAGIAVDFVGPFDQSYPTLPDGDHAGYKGRTIDFLDGFDQDLVARHDPDIVLLMAGTNDIRLDTADVMLADMRALLTSLTDASDATVMVATIPPVDPAGTTATRAARVDAFNAGLGPLVDELAAAGRDVRLVDMRTLTLDDISNIDVDSGVHPNDGGYEAIARFWADAIEDHLAPDADPWATWINTKSPVGTWLSEASEDWSADWCGGFDRIGGFDLDLGTHRGAGTESWSWHDDAPDNVASNSGRWWDSAQTLDWMERDEWFVG